MTIERAHPNAPEADDEDWTPLVRSRPLITGPEALLPTTIDHSVVPLQLEDDMAETPVQYRLVSYLASVLNWQLQDGPHYMFGNVSVYPPNAISRYDWVAPDLTLFVGMNPPDEVVKSYRINPPDAPAPSVVFEIASENTWDNDVGKKLLTYARMPVPEYFVYDPNTPRLWNDNPRLRGWRLEGGRLVEQSLDAQGRLWSAVLDSYLLADGAYLRLTDMYGMQRPTEGEAALTARQQAAAERTRTAVERRRAAAERRQAEAERQAKEKAQTDADVERAAKEKAQTDADVERAAKEKAWAMLRALGYDPESLQ